TANKENKDTVPKNKRITDYIYNWIKARYEALYETWNDDQFELVADVVFKTFYDKLDSIPEVIEISSDTEEFECTSTEELESSSISELKSSSTEDDLDDEEFSSLSAELVTYNPVLIKKSFLDEVKDGTEEEAEDDTDEEAEDDTDDET
nr:hypothetical protein [Tanacetum cinerariifolium]